MSSLIETQKIESSRPVNGIDNTMSAVLCVVLTFAVLTFDLLIPLGVAAGVPYIVVILLALRLRGRQPVLFFACLCTALTIFGFFFSPSGNELWKIIVNRFLAVFAIWITTILSLQRLRELDALSDKEHQLRSMANALPVLLAYIDKDLRFRFHNTLWHKWFGKSGQQLKATFLNGIVGEDIYRSIESRIDGALHGKAALIESEMSIPGRSKRHVQISLIPNLNGANVVSGLFLLIVDLTDHKHVESALRESKERYRLLVENAPVCIHEIDLMGRLISVNKTGLRMVDIETEEDICGKTYLDVVDSSDRTRIEMLQTRAFAGEASQFEFRSNCSGNPRHFFSSFVPIRDEKGAVIKIMGVSVDITVRKQTEKELDSQRAFFKQVIDINPNLIFAKDRDGRFTLANKALADAYGTTVENLLGATDADFNRNMIEVERFRRDDLETMDTLQDKFIPEEVITDALGRQRWLQTVKRPIIDENDRANQVLVVATDITERKMAENDLRESEERFRLLADSAPVMIWMSGIDTMCTYFNRRWLEFTGRKLEDELGNGWTEGLHPDDRDKCMDEYIDAFNKHQSFQIEFRLRRSDNLYCWVLGSGVPRCTQDGSFLGYIGSCLDISKIKQAEDALRESEERYRAVVESQTELVCRFLPDTTLTFVNEAYCRYFQKRREQLIGHQFLTLVPEEQRAIITKHLQSLAETPRTIQYEYEVILPDGTQGWQQWTDYPICGPTGEVGEFQSVGRDITERKQANELLKKARDELEIRVQERTAELSKINSALEKEILERKRTEGSLRKSYDLLNGVIEGTTDAVYVKDLDGRYLMINTAGARILGKAREDIIGKDDRDLFSPEAAQKIMQRDQQIILGETTQTYEERTTAMGITRTFFSTKGPLRDQKNHIIGLIGISRDITQRKVTEEALHASEERFRALYDHNPSMFFTVDTKGIVLSVNKFGAEQLGYTVNELIGIPVFNLFFEADRMTAVNQFKKFVNGAPPIAHWEIRKVHRSGSVLWVKETARIVKGIDDDLVILIVCENITDRKQAELELRKAHAGLEKRVRERTEELSNALSEVKNLKNRLLAENVYLQEEIKLSHNFEEIITNNDVLKKILTQVEQVATTEATVLILGESGTGKELIARAVHNLSARRERSLVKVDCGALPANLIESELFGHEKGAFTGASSRKIGRFELADRGTIFLDEIGELQLNLQTKLLRILQSGEFERLGSSSTIKVDVRIIAATNRNLTKAIQEGTFREDLYFRLNVFPIKIPPLRERKDDIPILTKYLIEKYAMKFGKDIKRIPQKTLNTLMAYDWPGNVRELENVIERAVIVTSGSTIELDEQLSFLLKPTDFGSTRPTIKEMEQRLIRNALEESNWVIQGKYGAAKRLDMPPSTLRERMKKYDMERPVKR